MSPAAGHMAAAEGGGPVPMGRSSPYREESRLRASPARTTLSFVVPALPKRVIARSRLVDRLDAVLDASLTSLWGPAGAGKSIAAAQWCRDRCPVPVAWVTIEEADTDHLVARVLARIATLCTRMFRHICHFVHPLIGSHLVKPSRHTR